MKAKLFVIGIMLLVGVVFAQTTFAQDAPDCSIPFKATVHQGQSAGTKLEGTLEITLDELGGLTGTILQDGQPDILVLGQVTGRAINLVIDLSTADNPGLLVFGVGTALDPFSAGTCGTVLGGPFVGPTEGDSGDWIAGGKGGPKPSVIWGT